MLRRSDGMKEVVILVALASVFFQRDYGRRREVKQSARHASEC